MAARAAVYMIVYKLCGRQGREGLVETFIKPWLGSALRSRSLSRQKERSKGRVLRGREEILGYKRVGGVAIRITNIHTPLGGATEAGKNAGEGRRVETGRAAVTARLLMIAQGGIWKVSQIPFCPFWHGHSSPFLKRPSSQLVELWQVSDNEG